MADKTPPFKTKTGKVLTDPDIETLADEAVRGCDVDVLKTRRRGRPMLGSAPSEVVPVRLDPDLEHAVEQRAAQGTQRRLRRFASVRSGQDQVATCAASAGRPEEVLDDRARHRRLRRAGDRGPCPKRRP